MPQQTALICHGGAGSVAEDRIAPCRDGVAAAATVGRTALEAGASALEAVERVVMALEDDPQFNAGHGSVLDERGEILVDAAIMSGCDQRAGAVAQLRGIANPVCVARRVMEEGRHVFLAGPGGEEFAREAGFAFCDPRSLVTPHERERWEALHGTVGAVARDREGRLAAATSTGGVVGKHRGRIGDSPLIGCGNWADGEVAVSCTGQGESFVRTALAKHAAMDYRSDRDPERTAEAAVGHMGTITGGEGGLILVDRQGRIARARNSPQMAVAGFGANGDIGPEV